MSTQDSRWHQRLSNYHKALSQLEEAVKIAEERALSKLEEQGLIQTFEFTHELAWKVMKDYFIYQGNASITGSRDATREAFQAGLIQEGEAWMEMIKSRNQTSHTYNEETAREIVDLIQNSYTSLFMAFWQKMETLKSGQQDSL
jgi:nucleotidyltransferase substrate binding protein (TIGR01987 family)